MEKITEFYKDILEVLGLVVDSKGGIFIKSGKVTLPITIDGLPVVLPTEENIKNVIDTSGDKPKVNFYLFNPAYEDPIRKNTSLQKLREIMYRRLENKLVAIIETLALIGLEDDVKSTGMEEFIELVLRFKSGNVKKLFDEGVLDAIRDIYKISKKTTNPKLNYLHIFLNKGGKVGNEKYNRIGNLAFPIYELLAKDFSVKKDTVEGVKLRNKDKGVILSGYEYIIKNPDDLINGITMGSKNKIAPGLHVLLLFLDFMVDKINKAIEDIKEDIDEEVYNSIKMRKLKINVNEIDTFLESIKSDIEYIPNEKDIENLLKQGTGVDYITPKRVNITGGRRPETNTTDQQTQQTNPVDPVELAFKQEQTQIVNPTYGQQIQPIQQGFNQPYQQYQQPMQQQFNQPVQPMYGQPMQQGFNQPYQQPMYQQPAQPMYGQQMAQPPQQQVNQQQPNAVDPVELAFMRGF